MMLSIAFGARLSKEERRLHEYNQRMRKMKERLAKKQDQFQSEFDARLENIKNVAEKKLDEHTSEHEVRKRRHQEHMGNIEREHESRLLQHIQIQADAEIRIGEDARRREEHRNRTKDRDKEHTDHFDSILAFKKEREKAHRMELKRIEEFIAELAKKEEDRKRKNLDPKLFEEKVIKMHGGPISFAFLDSNRDDVVTLIGVDGS